MKLLSLKITSDFRNLKGVNLQFDPANDTYVIIGNNGTGKTNILEALSSVFSVLLAHSQDFLFSFVLRYNIGDVEYWVRHKIDTKTTEYKKNNEAERAECERYSGVFGTEHTAEHLSLV